MTTDSIAGVALSHPDKTVFPEFGVTKSDLARYFEAIARWILPHVERRPLTVLRCPAGRDGRCFIQRHADDRITSGVGRLAVPSDGRTTTYVAARSLAELIALVQWGVVELHPWGSRAPLLDRPDRLIFDFDPGEGTSWADLVDGVERVRAVLVGLGLTAFLKTTGGKGLHVVVPVRATLDWWTARAFARAVARQVADGAPNRFVTTPSIANRKGRIFIDCLRNAEGATAVAAYSPRARTNAPVATPIAWEELSADVRFDHFTVRTVPDRLARLPRDPWAGFRETKQAITSAMLAGFGSIPRRSIPFPSHSPVDGAHRRQS